MLKKKKPDKILLYTIASLFIIGIVVLISASIGESKRDFNNIYAYFLHQLLFGYLLGGIVAYVAYKFPYKKLKKIAVWLFLPSLFLMILVFVPGISLTTRGANRWLDLGFVTFQPSELIKLTFIIYLAAWLSTHIRDISKKSSLISFSALLGVLVVLLILQPDLSTLGIIVATSVVMYYAAGARFKYLASIGAVGTGVLILFIQTSQYRLNRILTLLNPSADPLGLGYQINQILIAVGSGQFFGTGLLQGSHKKFLPLVMNDSIYAVWAEETGFIGSVILVLLFLLLSWRGFKIATLITDNFGKFIMVGLTVWFFVQASINIAAIIGIFPLTGVTLPFISYGSSSMIVTLVGAGLMLQLSKT